MARQIDVMMNGVASEDDDFAVHKARRVLCVMTSLLSDARGQAKTVFFTELGYFFCEQSFSSGDEMTRGKNQHGTGPYVHINQLKFVLCRMHKSSVGELMPSRRQTVKRILINFDI